MENGKKLDGVLAKFRKIFNLEGDKKYSGIKLAFFFLDLLERVVFKEEDALTIMTNDLNQVKDPERA